jgi:hypothetical protein
MCGITMLGPNLGPVKVKVYEAVGKVGPFKGRRGTDY